MKERLIEAIENSGLSRSEICRESGVSKSSLSEYIAGTSEPRSDSLEALATVLNVSPAWLIGLDAPKDFEQLNEKGKLKVNEYISDIINKYKK